MIDAEGKMADYLDKKEAEVSKGRKKLVVCISRWCGGLATVGLIVRWW